MPSNSNNQGLLSSWKEISAYLGCDERTCRRWELDHGLPAHRMEGSAKSRVYAYKNELDNWLKLRLHGIEVATGVSVHGGSFNQPEDSIAAKVDPRKAKRTKASLLFIPMAAVILAAALVLNRSTPGEPADFDIKGSTLIILDGKGKKLWDFDTGIKNLWSEKEYRDHFQFRRPSDLGRPLLPQLVIRDINHDGKAEVLFAPKTEGEFYETGIFCFDNKGRESWHYRPGRELRFGEHLYSADYRIFGIETFDISDDGILEIFLTTAHQPHSPSGLIALDCGGRAQGEFINWGRINDITCADLDGDRHKEILIAGLNDEYGKGFMALFNSDQIHGSSPQGVSYACGGCSPGSEIYYLLLPRTDIDKVLKSDKVAIDEIHLLRNNRIELQTQISHVFFELDFSLQVRDVKGSDYFRLQHHDLTAAGKITSVLDYAYYEALKKGVLYWNGAQWTSTPAMNRKQ